jgi:archaemetzincin
MRVFCLALFLANVMAAAEPAPAVIALQPFDDVQAERLSVVKQGLEKAYSLKVETLPVKPLPKAAWYAPRSRYRADILLDELTDHTPGTYRIVIGLTAKDISVTKDQHEDWGIFGLGQLGGRTCVVSTFRLGARGADEAKLRERLRKVAIHEVGHVMGLPHCPHEGCVMRDAEASIATVDAETGTFCESCAKAWREWLQRKDD